MEFNYVYVDLLEGKEQDDAMNEVEKWNPQRLIPDPGHQGYDRYCRIPRRGNPGGPEIMTSGDVEEKEIDRIYLIH